MLCIAKLLTEEMQAPPAPASKVSPKQRKTLSPKPQIKNERTDFSDGNDVDDASADELEVETVEHLTYNHDRQGILLVCDPGWGDSHEN